MRWQCKECKRLVGRVVRIMGGKRKRPGSRCVHSAVELPAKRLFVGDKIVLAPRRGRQLVAYAV